MAAFPSTRHRTKSIVKCPSLALLGCLVIVYLATIAMTQHYYVSHSSSTTAADTKTRPSMESKMTSNQQVAPVSNSRARNSSNSTPSLAALQIVDGHSGRKGTTGKHAKATLIAQVRGEMGNHLQKIAHGYGLLWYGREEPFSLDFDFRVRHLKKAKWRVARDDVVTCFVNFQTLDYESGHEPSFVKHQKAQTQWLQQQQKTTNIAFQNIYRIRNGTLREIETGLQTIKRLAEQPNKPYDYYPMVVLGGPMRNVLIDKFYTQYRKLFEFAHSACCAQLPEPDEVVFHFRHFAKELSLEEQRSRGFEELDPHRVAHVLMKDLQVGQKVAMTTRFGIQEPVVREYLEEFQRRGFKARLIVNQTGVQDFCFLLNAQQELLGVAKSTYARWAAYLGRAESVQLYALDNPGSQEFIQETMRYPWTHPGMTRRIQWRVIPSISGGA